MNERTALTRLRAFLHLLAAGLFVGTVAELLAAKHYDETVKLVPFALCGLGLAAIAVVWKRPDRRTVTVVRALMLVIALGSLWGIYEHVTGNLDFVHEVRPHADAKTVLKAGVQGGDPILAPAVLAVGAAVALAATYATATLATAGVRRDQKRLVADRATARDWVAYDR
jgi:hypothetical protein